MMGTSAEDKRSTDKLKLISEFLEVRTSVLKRGASDQQLYQCLKESSQTSTSQNASQDRTTPAPSTDQDQTWTLFGQRLVKRMADPTHRVHLLMLLCAFAVACLAISYQLLRHVIYESPCLVDAGVFTDEMFRPLVDCEVCRPLTKVAVERNVSTDTFYEKYAYSGIPVLVKAATVNWTAMSAFSFKFFQKLYRETEGALATNEEMCQFFPYKTEFLSLGEALNMSDERASFQPGEEPWYIGWSNCHDAVKKELRKHYERPYFLPPDSESVDVDWIFMGGPGPGALVHLDYVERPSWQAQISGRKTWQLIPSPECESVCKSFNVTVEKGDIIVVDTNIWYHSTFIHPGEISITIGSEFD